MFPSLRSACFAVLALGLLVTAAAAQKSAASAGVPSKMVVTVEPRKGATPTVINREDVMVYEGHDRDQVTDWVPAQGDHAGLQLYIVLDDGLDPVIGSQFEDLRKFITGLPASTEVALGYMRYGTVSVVQDFTTDHAKVAKALRLPVGDAGISSSPYVCLSDLMSKWPARPLRREVLMISDGVDPLFGAGLNNPYVDRAIESAQKAGIIIHSIYGMGAGHAGHTLWLLNWGQNYESQMTDETGGEFYYLGFGNAPSFAPWLQDLNDKLNHQYLLSFLPKAEKKSGMRAVKVRTEVHNVDLLAADRVYVPVGE